MVRLRPLTSRLRTHALRRLGRPPRVADQAVRSWTLSPMVDRQMPPALYDPADLDKIIGVPPDDVSVAREIEKAKGKCETHGATRVHELRDVTLSHGHLFTSRSALRLAPTAMPWLARRATAHIEQAALATTGYGIRYFGHWMLDDLPLMLAAEGLAPPVLALPDPSGNQRRYLAALALQPLHLESARFESLLVLEDHGLNDHKRDRYAALRERMRLSVTPQPSAGVMLLRGASGARRVLVNESEIAEMVALRGFRVLDPQVDSVDAITAACLDAKVVLGVEGSQLAAGVMWMSQRGSLLVLQPPQRFTTFYKPRCDCEGIRFAFVVGDPRGNSDFWIDPVAVGRMLDRLQ